jgi:RNA-directed DNA polymerase
MEHMVNPAQQQKQALTKPLMEEICSKENMNRAYKRVISNKGAPGIDGMRVDELSNWIKVNKESLLNRLLDGTYSPQPVKKVMIPKPNGGERMLGIPTVIDRLIQQAILQVIEPIIDPHFSSNSYGFRSGKSAHQALKAAQEYVADKRTYVVDIDIEKFFDRVNHDMVMVRLAKYVKDKRLLQIIGKFLRAGIMDGDTYIKRVEGTPQGGALSPILANILLDDLDKELENRGHKFCRYADDCNVYVRSKPAAERVLESLKKYIENKLKLQVNPNKSDAIKATKCTFLGYKFGRKASLVASERSLKELKRKVRNLTSRTLGRKLDSVIADINLILRGWMGYFHLDKRKTIYAETDGWIRRRIRCYRLKQRKGGKSLAKWLIHLGANERDACHLSSSGKGWWRLSRTRVVSTTLNNRWINELGLISLQRERDRLNS